MIRYTVFMEDCHQMLRKLMIYKKLIDLEKYHKKERCAIYYGQIRRQYKDGLYQQEEQDIFLVETQSNNSVTTTG